MSMRPGMWNQPPEATWALLGGPGDSGCLMAAGAWAGAGPLGQWRSRQGQQEALLDAAARHLRSLLCLPGACPQAAPPNPAPQASFSHLSDGPHPHPAP